MGTRDSVYLGDSQSEVLEIPRYQIRPMRFDVRGILHIFQVGPSKSY